MNIHSWKYASGLLVAGFLAITSLLLLPYLGTAVEKQQVLNYQNEQFEFMDTWQGQLMDIEEKQQLMEERMGSIAHGLIEEDLFASILEQLFEDAQSSLVVIQRIQPTEEISSGEYIIRNILIDVTGTYHNIAGLVNKIERSTMLIQVNSVALEKDEQELNMLQGSVNLEITMARK